MSPRATIGVVLALLGCQPVVGGLDAGADAGDSVLVDAGACPAATVTEVPVPGAAHEPIGTVIQYDSNPPAGGDHYPVWAVWGVHSDAVPAEYFVHNEEHGGVVLLYHCDAGCPDVVSALTALAQSQPPDPLCESQGTGVISRMLVLPDPSLDVPVAAAAWGWTYKEPAPCVDPGSLQAFIDAHYGNGPEQFCAQGSYQ
ncbi:MAG: DUF3105 domain-containing protein [Deltaproteobacteria bacterium]